jgi:Leucine-rich repeat (LRR) protein
MIPYNLSISFLRNLIMSGNQLTSISGKTVGLIVAHPVGVAIIGGLLVGTGAYYLGKAIAKRNDKKAISTEGAGTEPAAA